MFCQRCPQKTHLYAGPSPFRSEKRFHHPDPRKLEMRGWKAALKEADIPQDGWRAEQARALKLGLQGADSLDDKSIPTFSRGELPHFAGINTFLKAPYAEDVRDVARYDAAILGVPFDGGTTYRPGTRFGPQGMRKISALYTPYNYELGVDLREQMTLCDAGDVFTIPANIEKTFDQISRAVGHVFPLGHCQSSWAGIIPSVLRPCAVLRNVPQNGSGLSILIVMRIFRSAIWMSACTPPPGFTPPI